jgi:long-subunit fatty acid transport protein
MQGLICLALSTALILLPFGLFAGEGNYRDYLVGDRAAGMGGAALALASSVESCFYNPGGLARTESNTVSLSASLYGLSNYRVKDGWAPERDIDIDSFLVIPTAFGSVWKVSEDWRLAFSAFVPRMDRINDLDAYGEMHETAKQEMYQNLNRDDQMVWLGPTVACRIGEAFSVGLSVFGVYRTYSNLEQYIWNIDAGRPGYYMHSTLSSQVKYNDLSLLPVFGAQYHPDPHWSFGLTAQPPSLHLDGSGEWISAYNFMSPGDDSEHSVQYMRNADTKNTIPAQIAAGAAWSEPGRYALAFDLIYHFYASGKRLSGKTEDGDTVYHPFKNKPVVDFSLGGEYYLAENYPLRAGFFSSFSSSPTPTGLETASYPAKIDKYGLTASIGRETENTSFNLGINYSWGSGKHIGFAPGDIVPTSARESFLYVFAGTSYFF